MADVEAADIYAQQCAQFGRMNDILYKMPVVFSTIIGGLWYFAASYIGKDRLVAVGVFLFAAIASVCFIFASIRFRLAFNAYIDSINKFDGEHKISIRSSKCPSTVKALIFLVAASAVFSVVAAIYALLKCDPS